MKQLFILKQKSTNVAFVAIYLHVLISSQNILTNCQDISTSFCPCKTAVY